LSLASVWRSLTRGTGGAETWYQEGNTLPKRRIRSRWKAYLLLLHWMSIVAIWQVLEQGVRLDSWAILRVIEPKASGVTHIERDLRISDPRVARVTADLASHGLIEILWSRRARRRASGVPTLSRRNDKISSHSSKGRLKSGPGKQRTALQPGMPHVHGCLVYGIQPQVSGRHRRQLMRRSFIAGNGSAT
jgi:hypothetical protein